MLSNWLILKLPLLVTIEARPQELGMLVRAGGSLYQGREWLHLLHPLQDPRKRTNYFLPKNEIIVLCYGKLLCQKNLWITMHQTLKVNINKYDNIQKYKHQNFNNSIKFQSYNHREATRQFFFKYLY